LAILTRIEMPGRYGFRCRIYADDNFLASAHKQAVKELGLAEGMLVDEQDLPERLDDCENRLCYQAGITYLAKMARSAQQVQQYLLRKGFDAQAAEKAVARLLEQHYLDDALYAEMIVRERGQFDGMGRAGLLTQLKRAGISGEIANEALQDITPQWERERALQLLEKLQKQYRGEMDPDKKKRRIAAAMARKGYRPALIAELLRLSREE